MEVFPGSADQLQQWTTTRTASPSCSNGRALARLAVSPENNQSKSSVDHGVLLAQPGVELRRKKIIILQQLDHTAVKGKGRRSNKAF